MRGNEPKKTIGYLFLYYICKTNLIKYSMIQKPTFSISFYQRTDKIDKANTAPVFMRITVNGERAEIATNRRFDVNKWSNGKAIGNSTESKNLTNYLLSLREKVYDIYRYLLDRNEIISASHIKQRYQGIGANSLTLIDAFENHNEQMKKLVGKDYSIATLKRYRTTLRHIQEFLKKTYNINDIFLTELKYQFITDLELFLKTERKCDHNTSIKYIKNFRKIINNAVKNEWLIKDPFDKYTCRLKEVERGFLNEDELQALESKQLSINRIDVVRDIFVFACYTGLAYAEVYKLSKEHLMKGIDGEMWINIRRTKTDNKSMIPLLPKAAEIIEKYKEISNNLLLPVISNQKMNAYLKEIADLCGITKTLTFHLARHTFATTVTLTNGVSIESVSAMLGHKSIRTTQIYSKVVELKVSNDMAELKKKLAIKV